MISGLVWFTRWPIKLLSTAAWPVGSSGCKHTKSSITFGAWLGLDCQANNIFLLGSYKLFCIIYNCKSLMVHIHSWFFRHLLWSLTIESSSWPSLLGMFQWSSKLQFILRSCLSLGIMDFAFLQCGEGCLNNCPVIWISHEFYRKRLKSISVKNLLSEGTGDLQRAASAHFKRQMVW